MKPRPADFVFPSLHEIEEFPMAMVTLQPYITEVVVWSGCFAVLPFFSEYHSGHKVPQHPIGLHTAMYCALFMCVL